MSAPYIPDVGDTFEVTRTWEYRRWQWAPFPWNRLHVSSATHSYRVDAWMRRRPVLPVHYEDEGRQRIHEMFAEMIADGRIDMPRGFGPDNVPLEWCRREDAEYVSGVGVAGTIQRIADVTVTGRVSWDEKTIQADRDFANSLAGEPLR